MAFRYIRMFRGDEPVTPTYIISNASINIEQNEFGPRMGYLDFTVIGDCPDLTREMQRCFEGHNFQFTRYNIHFTEEHGDENPLIIQDAIIVGVQHNYSLYADWIEYTVNARFSRFENHRPLYTMTFDGVRTGRMFEPYVNEGPPPADIWQRARPMITDKVAWQKEGF